MQLCQSAIDCVVIKIHKFVWVELPHPANLFHMHPEINSLLSIARTQYCSVDLIFHQNVKMSSFEELCSLKLGHNT